jgi:hypothetical protein
MEEDTNLVTREQYLEMLIDAWFRDAAELESGLLSWCEKHAQPGAKRDTMKRGSVSALKWHRAIEVFTVRSNNRG